MDNIIQAIETTVKNKKRSKAIYQEVYRKRRLYARKIRWLLKSGSFTPKRKPPFTRRDPINGKLRAIDSAPFWPDQIVHTLLIQTAKPYFTHSMIDQCCACVPGRGPHYGKKYITRWAKITKKKYFVKLDIKKYYPSVSNHAAADAVKRKFKPCLWRDTFLKVLNTYPYLPIGLLTSQWTANLILERTDHFAKETLKIKYYLRYMDDVLMMGYNKRELAQQAEAYSRYLKDTLNLTIKPNWNIHRFDYKDRRGRRRGKPIDMLGFRFYADHTAIRRGVFKRIRRRCIRYTTRNPTLKTASALLSSYGWIKATDTQTFYKTNLQPHFKHAKEMIRHENTERPGTASPGNQPPDQ